MKTTYKTIIGLAILALLLAPLGIAMATADGDPVVSSGYDDTVDFKAAIKFQSFNNSYGAVEVLLGQDGLPAGSATQDFKWREGLQQFNTGW
jgi:hypothetical protein